MHAGTIVVAIAEQVVAQRAGCVGEPDGVVEVAALSAFCVAHPVAGVGDVEDAISEQEPDPEAGGCQADYGPFVRHGGLLRSVVAVALFLQVMMVAVVIVIVPICSVVVLKLVCGMPAIP